MPHEISEDQLVHYFAGECSEQEAAEIEAWINADPDRKKRVARLRKLWEAAKSKPRDRSNVDAMWANLTRRLGAAERTEDPPNAPRDEDRKASDRREERSPRTPQTHSSLFFRVSAIVASVVVFLVAVSVLVEYQGSEKGESSTRSITTEIGQRAQIQLEDGTEVTLNAESELRLPAQFGEHKREVHLEGQAYFEVEPDASRPFLVYAGESVTEVLGTKFDIDAYPDDETVRVVVAKGKVSVRSAQDQPDNNVTLTEQQMASVSKSDRLIVRREVDPAPYVAWTHGQLVFKDASFSEVAQRLRSWYGLEVELVGSAEEVDRLNVTFGDASVDEVVRIIAETLDLKVRREGEKVIFIVAG